jgi:hypothetical protein
MPEMRQTIHQGLGVQQDQSKFYLTTLLISVRQMSIGILLYMPEINRWI